MIGTSIRYDVIDKTLTCKAYVSPSPGHPALSIPSHTCMNGHSKFYI